MMDERSGGDNGCFAQRIAHLKPEGAYQVLAQARELEAQGREIIHLEVGQPDVDTFSNISQAGVQAIHDGRTRYVPPAGVKELREAIAADAGHQRGMSVDPDQVLISPGAKPNLYFPTMALVEPGDEVIYPDPGFPTYPAMIGAAGGVPIPIPLVEENDFSFDLEAFDQSIGERTKLIILNSPGNPTGGVMPLTDLEHIAAAALEYNCWVMSDEIYARIVYEGISAPSMGALPGMAERTIIVDGFSKTYAMTGWRLGFGIMPKALAKKVELLFTHSFGCTAHFTQYAGLEALMGSQEQVDETVAIYRQRRDVIVKGLNDLPGIRCLKPQGAFYVFPNIRATGLSSGELASILLEEAGVALLPGTAFGEHGEGYLRLSYANTVENIEKALHQMGKVLERIVG
jgi:aspartate aminotransferase